MYPCLKLRHLEERLQCISGFQKPKILLEQYITPPHLGSHMLFTVQVLMPKSNDACVFEY